MFCTRSLLRSHRRVYWAGILATGSFALAGCGGGGDAAPSGAATNAVSSPDGGHGAAGGDQGEAMPGSHSDGAAGGHGSSASVTATTTVDGHGDPHADPHGSHGVTSGAANAHGDMHGAPMGMHGSAVASHGTPSGGHGSPSGMHGSPDYAHLPPPGEGSPTLGAHDGGAMHSEVSGQGRGTPGSAGNSTGRKATTESWLAGLAAGVMSGGDGAPTQPGVLGPEGAHGALPGGYGGEMSGVPGYEGVPGAAGAGQQAAAQEFEEGTAEYAAQQLVLKMQAGETTGYAEIISDKTKEPTLSALRDGTADAETMSSNKELVQGASLVTIRESGASKLFVIKTGSGKVITITTREDGETQKVMGFKVDTPRVRGRVGRGR